jgi:hypothetical protein
MLLSHSSLTPAYFLMLVARDRQEKWLKNVDAIQD